MIRVRTLRESQNDAVASDVDQGTLSLVSPLWCDRPCTSRVIRGRQPVASLAHDQHEPSIAVANVPCDIGNDLAIDPVRCAARRKDRGVSSRLRTGERRGHTGGGPGVFIGCWAELGGALVLDA